MIVACVSGFWAAERVFDLDLVAYIPIAVALVLGFSVGSLDGFCLGASIHYLRVRGADRGFVAAGSVAFIAFTSLSFNKQLTINGEWYGWPFPALGFNFIEEIHREVSGIERNFYEWGVWTPGLLFDGSMIFCVTIISAILASISWRYLRSDRHGLINDKR